MVAISLSGSGEGLGRAIARGYSTGNDEQASLPPFPRSLSPRRRGAGIHAAFTEHGCVLPLAYRMVRRETASS